MKRNRLLTAGATGFSYDKEGQLSDYGTVPYSFDYAHRLVSTGGGNPSQYAYDGFGNRLSATRNGATTKYIYDAFGNLLVEVVSNTNSTDTRHYIHGLGLLAMVITDQTYTYHYNAIGSTIAMTDQGQNMVNKYAYSPFGGLANMLETVPQPFKFVGQFGIMPEPNGLYYMRARYYDQQTGRFISEDPIGFAGGDVNLYAYVQNNPVNAIDPEGKFFNFVTGGIGAAIGSAVGATNAVFNGGSIWKGAAIGAGTGALAGFTFGGSIWAQAAIHGALSAGSDVFQQKLTNPCDDLRIGSVVASGIAGALGGCLGKTLIKPGGMTPANSAVLAGGLAGIANVFLTGATQPVYK